MSNEEIVWLVVFADYIVGAVFGVCALLINHRRKGGAV